MVISALVLTLSLDPVVRARALDALGADPRLTLGALIETRLPVVAEAASTADGASLCDQLSAHLGVERVDVIAIDFLEDS